VLCSSIFSDQISDGLKIQNRNKTAVFDGETTMISEKFSFCDFFCVYILAFYGILAPINESQTIIFDFLIK